MTDDPLVLGIESSCDDTGVALVRGRTLLFDAVSREKPQCPREPRGIVEPGKVPGSGLHRQLGMLFEETGILGSAAAARRRTHRRATAPASKIVLLGVLRRHA